MLELLYATGLRVSELCRLGVGDLKPGPWGSADYRQGNKQRLVPVGKEAIRAVEDYLANGRRRFDQKGRARPALLIKRARPFAR